jgi:diaminopimelate decarboxylase
MYANPCKKDDHLLYAKENGIKLMTFDCSEEA